MVIAGHATWFTLSVVLGGRFSAVSGGRFAVAAAVLAVHAMAVAGLMRRRPYSAAIRWGAVVLVLLAAARLHIPRYMLARKLDQPADDATALVQHLRELSASQEQFRLRTGHYAATSDSMASLLTPMSGVQSVLRANGEQGWAASATRGEAQCAIWVRDSSLRTDPRQLEGMPYCAGRTKSNHRSPMLPRSAMPAREASQGMRRPVTGTWRQHRADERRTGIIAAEPGDVGHWWTTQVDGELRSSVAVAGSQVFVGAHGNGEFVSLSLDSGHVDWRIRVANWVHHQPVVTPDLVIVTFGSNDYFGTASSYAQPPGGIAAYDRRTGRERWHHYLKSSVMTSPVLGDSLVAVTTTDNEAIAWRVADGTETWRTTLPSHSWMGNPMVVGDRMVIGLEFTRLCVLGLSNGRIDYCTEFKGKGWGAGHASVTLANELALIVYNEDIPVGPAVRAGLWKFLLTRMLGIAGTAEQQMLVAIELATGHERWRTPLGGISGAVIQGHIAGTPVVVDGVAYVPSPLNGHITAVHAESGHVLWSTAVNAARGSVLVTQGAVLSATSDGFLVVLDAANGVARCHLKLPGASDRAGPTLAGKTALLSLRNGLVFARPIDDLLHCRA